MLDVKEIANNYFGERALDRFRDARFEPQWMGDYRSQAFRRFTTLPWPTTKDEEWRRTNVSHIPFGHYALLDGFDGHKGTSVVQALARRSGQIHFTGHYSLDSVVKKSVIEKGVIFTTFSDAMNRFPELLKRGFEKINQRYADDKFGSLTNAFWSHGVLLYVPEFVELNEPFVISYEEAGHKNASLPITFLVLEEGARATVLQSIRSKNEGEIFRSALVDLNIAASAGLQYFEIQNLNQNSLSFSNSWANVDRDGEFYSLTATFGSNLTKTKLGSALQGSGSHARLHGVYFGDRHQHFDQRTIQLHQAPHASSTVQFKGAVKDEAHTIYQGLIKVFEDAQKTDAYQSNKNLVLNSRARTDSIPSLEIEANDVRCTHGATAGRINQDEVFYLMSRGLPRNEARKMIISGFFEDIIKDVPEAFQEDFRLSIDDKLNSTDEEGINNV